MDNATMLLLASSWLDRLGDSFLSPSHNLRVIYLGVCSLGLAAGICGCFLLFRKRSLLSDTVGHATLPGVAFGFLLIASLGGGGKSFVLLMLGALVTGWLSVRAVQWIRHRTPVREDGALAIPLSVFYGLGVVGLSVIQGLQLRDASGLEYYLYGMVASMVQAEAQLLLVIALGAIAVVFLFFKELNSLCFDEGYVAAQGLPNRWLDEVLMFTCLTVTIVGLQAVGLLLMMALFIIPPATARLWTDSMPWTLAIAGAVGAFGALAGSIASSVVPHLPAGASIILATSLLFFISMLVGKRKGWLVRKLSLYQLERRLARHQFLRGMFDKLESQQQVRLLAGLDFSPELCYVPLAIDDFLGKRDWPKTKQLKIARSLMQCDMLEFADEGKVILTDSGLKHALEVARTHRLTELYLIEHAEIAPAMVHQYVERIEEITTPEIASDLKSLFAERLAEEVIPTEPHAH